MDYCQRYLPNDMTEERPLPGIQPVKGAWLTVDEAYGGQMARREALLRDQRETVLWQAPEALEPGQELLDIVLALLPGLGFQVRDAMVHCPDGRAVPLERSDPLGTLGRVVQCDFVLLDKVADEHVLKGAVLCFPASWLLAEKAGRPLIAIHEPVDEYDGRIAARVQRLFDGVQSDRPLWRFNRLWYEDPELFQPRSRQLPRRVGYDSDIGPYYRSERQTILRLPRSRWAVFAIHTYVLRAEDTPFAKSSETVP